MYLILSHRIAQDPTVLKYITFIFMNFISPQYQMAYPALAQLVEHWTVVRNKELSNGRWFESGRQDVKILSITGGPIFFWGMLMGRHGNKESIMDGHYIGSWGMSY